MFMVVIFMGFLAQNDIVPTNTWQVLASIVHSQPSLPSMVRTCSCFRVPGVLMNRAAHLARRGTLPTRCEALQDAQVGTVASPADATRGRGSAHGAVGFVAVATVTEAAAPRHSELRETVAHLFGVEALQAQRADPRRVDDPRAVFQPPHARPRRRVVALAVVAHGTDLTTTVGIERVQERRLADAGMTDEHTRPAGEVCAQRFQPRLPLRGAREHRHL